MPDDKVAPGSEPAAGAAPGTPAPTTTPVTVDTVTLTKGEGDSFTDAEGKKWVPEHHLMAAKEGAKTELATAQTAHDTALTGVRSELSESQTATAAARAEAQTAKSALAEGVGSSEELTKTKESLVTANTAITAGNEALLKSSRENIMLRYGVAADKLEGKDQTALGLYAEALASVGAKPGNGAGQYPIGGGIPGAQQPETPLERADRVMNSAPRYSGSRNPEKVT